MTQNYELFRRDPRETRLPNDGVAKVVAPRTSEEWAVLRHELETFVCEGEYRHGLDRILGSYLGSLGRETQPAVWVSGFFGSGKSHLVRVLEYLWRDTPLPDGASARSVANLTEDITAHLVELAQVGRRYGGVWSAAGTLGAATSESVRLAFLSIVFRGAGLHEKYPQARFKLWLMHEGLFEAVETAVHERGRDLERELTDMYVSPSLAESLLAVRPDFAHDSSVTVWAGCLPRLPCTTATTPSRRNPASNRFACCSHTPICTAASATVMLPLTTCVSCCSCWFIVTFSMT